MIARFFARRGSASQPEGSVPPGERIYAIGDIHGRHDLLDVLIEQIDADDRARGASRTQIIFLGDFVDRGAESARVIDRALQIEAERENSRFLLGNHEEVFLKALQGDLKALTLFTRIGGRETALSYGISEDAYRDADYPGLAELLRAHVPAEHIAFMERLEDLIIAGDYAFVHAGVRPGLALAHQNPSDLRWIRSEFLNHKGGFEKIVVHGHTITEQVDFGSHRIGLDTGAYASGKLTAMGFEGNQRWVLATA